MKHLDLFTGIGGFSLAAQHAGITTVAHSEIDRYASSTLENQFPYVPNLGDVSQLKAPNGVDIITAGSPCQDYSVAGKRAGTAGARSGLIAHTFRLADETKAEWLVIENVPGLLSSNDGRDLGAVLGTLADLGMGFAWRVLDAQAFGVPQRRRRLFIVGRAGGSPDGPAEVLSVGQGLPIDTPASSTARPNLATRPETSARSSGVVNALTRSGLGGGGPDDNMAQAGHIVGCLTTTMMKHDENTAQQGYLVVDSAKSNPTVDSDVCHPLTAGRSSAAVLTKARCVRKLTPLECERLQGYPDGWTEGSSDTQRYRQLGNSVAVPVVTWLMRRTQKVNP